MMGTTEDYLRFSMMLANGGWFQGKRILGKKTVEFMTADHTMLRPGRPAGLGFGLGFEVRQRDGRFGTAGIGRRVWLGRQRRHALLDRPEGAADRDLHGAGAPRRSRRAAQPLPHHGAGRDHRLAKADLHRSGVYRYGCDLIEPGARRRWIGEDLQRPVGAGMVAEQLGEFLWRSRSRRSCAVGPGFSPPVPTPSRVARRRGSRRRGTPAARSGCRRSCGS